jgi:mono/diheme cytochrome c family protein
VQIRPLRPLGGTVVIAATLLTGCDRGADPGSGASSTGSSTATVADAAWHSARGEDLLATSNCTACHAADADTRTRLAVAPGP